MTSKRPTHHTQDGFRNPWPDSHPRAGRDVLRWLIRRRLEGGREPDPPYGSFATAQPDLQAGAGPDELALTWVGHSTLLMRTSGITVLTDPIWSDRASPVQFAGPKRLMPPAVRMDALPTVDVVLLTHNHYDHMDERTIRRLARASSDAEWVAPVGLARTLRRWGVQRVRELDWWQTTEIGATRVSATPARHFSARGLHDRMQTLWCGYAMEFGDFRVFFAGDTGYHPAFGEIAERHGPFDVTLLPVGAYEPRWFMEAMHMNPEDAVRAYQDMVRHDVSGRLPVLVPIHWGTFRLTDEAMDEPPRRTAAAWSDAGLPAQRLWVLKHGETRRLAR